MFKINQRVVCVDDDCPDDHVLATVGNFTYVAVGDLDGLKNGTIYTIRDIVRDPVLGTMCLRVHEIIRDPLPGPYGPYETGYLISRFRPVIERKTDISIFTAMLGPKQRVGA